MSYRADPLKLAKGNDNTEYLSRCKVTGFSTINFYRWILRLLG